VINIISFSVRHIVPGAILSMSVRMLVVGLAKLPSHETREHGITVNNVASGLILTDRIGESALRHELSDSRVNVIRGS
jgi:NAD(P)-dependent dehydrogenase (short-subunit alcohol dehydrogenase family)